MFRNKNGSSTVHMETLNSILGKGSVINGTVKIENSVRLDGRLIGELHSTGLVTIGPDGDVDGNIYARSAVIGGKVKGSIQTTDQITLEVKSVVVGDLKTTKLTIDEGAMFEGNCNMEPKKDYVSGSGPSTVTIESDTD